MEVLFPCGDLLLTCRRNQFRPLVADSFCGSSICGSVDALKAGADKPQMVKLRECLTDISHLGEATGVLRYFLLPIFEQIVVRLRHLHYGIQVLFLRTLRHGIDAAFDAFSDFRFHRADLCEKVLVHMEFVHDNGCTGQAFLYITTVSAGHVHCDYLNICVVIDHVFYRIGEDEQGEMIALDAEKVLSIPRKIRSQEVVRRGFMSNYLFQNISGIFSAPQEVIDIISKFTPAEEPKAKDIPVTPNTKDELNINPETGDVEIPQEQVIGMAKDMFGDKIYATVEDGTLDTQIKSAFDDAAAKSQDAAQSAFDDFKEKFKSETVKSIIGIAKEKYQENIRVSDAKALEKGLNSQFDRAANKVYNSYQIEQNTAESDRLDALRSRHETGKSEAEIEAEFEQKKKELQDSLQEQLSDAVKSFIETSTQSVVETTEKKIKEREKAGIEDSVRDHLRGFSRTIPSFLMAYGDDTVTLATFDAVIPNPVFLEVTSITLDQFRFLRDGGKYTDAETGEERDFAGNLFDPVVFDDSVKEFLRLKKKLADYFDEKSIEDIFDYIPPQKTNQIFTPKTMVKKMVDMLEAENPGCFDDPDKTFIDLYMKSGLYITEIVKRLYQSEQMKKQFPDPKERLRHIFEKQVYGLAPTEIIYHIALSYILGFNNEDTKDIKHNFRQLDALPYAKEGTLQQKLDELFS